MLNSINSVNNNRQSFGMAITTQAAERGIKAAGDNIGLLERLNGIAQKAAQNQTTHVHYTEGGTTHPGYLSIGLNSEEPMKGARLNYFTQEHLDIEPQQYLDMLAERTNRAEELAKSELTANILNLSI